uniref:Thioredoxin domain-containing protein n=1 Tax=Oryza rufipogon TaxID=4529 RepID=A0A0E0R0K0_ORYRU
MRLPLLAAALPLLLSLLAASQLGASATAAAASSGAAASGRAEWQVLTRANFSSQIRLHPHILLVVTMPWYGESRSLMAEIERLVAADEQELGHLKLMAVYRNSEKLLTDVLGATEGIKFIYYQRSLPFKYEGKLRAREILSSVHYIMSLKHAEAPFVVLHTKEDVEAFVESTDKAVVLSEFCGWFSKLAHGGSNRTEGTSSKNHTENVDISGKALTGESDGPLELVIEDEELIFGGGVQLAGSPWKGGFTLANGSMSDQNGITTDENRKLCTAEKLQQFESFYAKLTALSRDYFLPPEKVRFGLITERSSLPSSEFINEGNSETWFLSVHYLGCTNCSIVAKEGDDLRSLLQSYHNLNINEMDIDASGIATFPASRSSAILFIDRLSDSSKVRDESKLSLKLLREYVQKNYPSHFSTGGLTSGKSRMSSKAVPSLVSTGRSAHTERTRLNDWASKLMEIGEKMSVMVVNDGESISYRSDSQGSTDNPLYDILTKLIHKTRPAHRSKKTKISFVAKDVAIKKLSDDSEVQVVESLSIRDSQLERNEGSCASSDGGNDDYTEDSVHENRATEAEYINDRQAPIKLEKGPANYCDNNEKHLESSDTEVEEEHKTKASDVSLDLQEDISVDVHSSNAPKNFCKINKEDLDCSDTKMEEQEHKTEASDTSADLQEEVSTDVHSSNEVGHILHKHKDEETVREALDILEPDGTNVNFNQQKSGSANQQDAVFSVLGQESRRIEDAIYEDNLFILDEGSEESDSKYPVHAALSSSSSLVGDNTYYTEQETPSIPDEHFAGSLFFSDGGYRLLQTLTGGSRMPSLVIIDPIQQKHYVFPDEIEFTYPSLANFLDHFMNRSLSPYYRSALSVISSKELLRPPFINRDFHEADSIPQLTTSNFCMLVFGFEGCVSKSELPFSNTENISSAWKKDVLVLFSNSWCGFCQRTELVVREVYRSFKNFLSSNSQFLQAQDLQIEEKEEESTMKGFPAIYLIDCTSNECHHLLKSVGKEERYPTLLFFPAENKSAISYERGISVSNLFEFLESHASNSPHLLEYKGFLWKKKTVVQGDAPQAIQFDNSDKSSNDVGSHSPSHSERNEARVLTGSVLTATSKLGSAVPFDNSQVLIVSADSREGFHGLIINKRLSWDTFKNLDGSMEPIKHAPLFYGGPVVVQGYYLVSLSRVAFDGYLQVIPGVYYGNVAATAQVTRRIKSGEQSAENLWFFLGFSNWEYSQLFDELSEGAWQVSEEPIEHLVWPEN